MVCSNETGHTLKIACTPTFLLTLTIFLRHIPIAFSVVSSYAEPIDMKILLLALL